MQFYRKDDEFVLLKVDGFLKKRGFKVAEQPSATKEELARRHFHFVMNCSKLGNYFLEISFKNEFFAGLCSKNTPLSTLQDLLEMSSIEECKQIFSIVEENMNEFKQVKSRFSKNFPDKKRIFCSPASLKPPRTIFYASATICSAAWVEPLKHRSAEELCSFSRGKKRNIFEKSQNFLRKTQFFPDSSR